VLLVDYGLHFLVRLSTGGQPAVDDDGGGAGDADFASFGDVGLDTGEGCLAVVALVELAQIDVGAGEVPCFALSFTFWGLIVLCYSKKNR
jgi:hypothetical protein